MSDARTAELAANLTEVQARVDAACHAAGRDPGEVTLIVVTKTWPSDDVRRLAGLGVRDVGENRDQEAAPKAAATEGLDLRWHFIGQLQTNKAASVARYADLVHSVDRPSLVAALDKGAAKAGRRIGCLIEVDLTEPDSDGSADAPGQNEGRGGARRGDGCRSTRSGRPAKGLGRGVRSPRGALRGSAPGPPAGHADLRRDVGGSGGGGLRRRDTPARGERGPRDEAFPRLT